MAPFKKRTPRSQNTPVYERPLHPENVNRGRPVLYLLPDREILFTEVHETTDYKYGKITNGWVLMKFKDEVFFEEDPCPVCYCPPDNAITLPCCNNKMCADCFLMQLKSGAKQDAKKYDMTHMRCPFCRDIYHNHWGQFKYGTPRDALQKADPRYMSVMEPIMKTYERVKYLIDEKERGLPESERGGWAIYNCEECTKHYIPGKLSCAEELELDLENTKLICGECEWQKQAQDHRCFKHGKKFAIFKCDSCCSIASWDCYSNHYCERCHNQACTAKFYPCPGPEKCPLGMAHPANCTAVHGQNNMGFVIGCYKCQDESYQAESYNDGAPDPFLIDQQKDRNFRAMFAYEAKIEEEKHLLNEGLAAGRGYYSSDESDESDFEDSDEEFMMFDNVPRPRQPVIAAPADDFPNDLAGFHLFYDSEECESEDSDFIVEDDLRGFHLFGGDSESDSSDSDSDSDSDISAPVDVYAEFLCGFGDVSDCDSEESIVDEEWNAYHAQFLSEFPDSSESESDDSSDELLDKEIPSQYGRGYMSLLIDCLRICPQREIREDVRWKQPASGTAVEKNNDEKLPIDIEQQQNPFEEEKKINLAYQHFIAGFGNSDSEFDSEEESESSCSSSSALWTTDEEVCDDQDVVELVSRRAPRQEILAPIPIMPQHSGNSCCGVELNCSEAGLEMPKMRAMESF